MNMPVLYYADVTDSLRAAAFAFTATAAALAVAATAAALTVAATAATFTVTASVATSVTATVTAAMRQELPVETFCQFLVSRLPDSQHLAGKIEGLVG